MTATDWEELAWFWGTKGNIISHLSGRERENQSFVLAGGAHLVGLAPTDWEKKQSCDDKLANLTVVSFFSLSSQSCIWVILGKIRHKESKKQIKNFPDKNDGLQIEQFAFTGNQKLYYIVVFT